MLLLLLLQAAAQIAPSAPPVPTDWAALAPMPYVAPPLVAPSLSAFVAQEVAAGRCTVPKPADGHYTVQLDVAALVDGDGVVRRAVPRAIQCPTVEQYGAGLVQSFARSNLRPSAGGERWYLTTIVFDWRG